MTRLKPLAQSKIIKILKKNGFQKIRSGKHITFKKIVSPEKILTTWVPHHHETTVFVIQYIIKQTEKSRSEFES